MIVKGIIFQDFVNYKNPCMTIMMPICNFKCDRECGSNVCQNSALAKEEGTDVDIEYILDQYINDSLTDAVVFQGLEPFDSFEDLKEFIKGFSKVSDDDIVIYTGYKEDEISDKVNELKLTLECKRINIGSKLKNPNKLIIKFGRYIPDQKSHYDEVLGVDLASDNQYAKII